MFPFASVLLGGCSPGPTSSGGPNSCGDGKLLLLWTIKGQPATAAGCQGVAQLVVDLETTCGSVEIEPVPCERDGAPWRYDGLPEGDANVQVTALDANNRAIAVGYVRTAIGPDLPATAVPVDLN